MPWIVIYPLDSIIHPSLQLDPEVFPIKHKIRVSANLYQFSSHTVLKIVHFLTPVYDIIHFLHIKLENTSLK